jgi:hypothetical protein
VDFNAVADELFGLPPAGFIERRNVLAAAARSDNDTQLADRIKALHRPTVGAALVNAFVRERGDVFAGFLSLGTELRDAQARGDGEQLRALAGRRQQLMRDLDRDIAVLAEERELTATRAVQQDVHATMLAALSDPQAAAIVRSGHLESALHQSSLADAAPRHTDRESAQSSSTDARESAERALNEANASAAAADRAVEQLAAAVSSAQLAVFDLENQLAETLNRARLIDGEKSVAEGKVAAAQDAYTEAIKEAKVLRGVATKARTTYERENAD